MIEKVKESFAQVVEALRSMDPVNAVIFAAFFLTVWFLPAILAVFTNPRHAGKIFIANVPAIASWVAWIALLSWAIGGLLRQKDLDDALEEGRQRQGGDFSGSGSKDH